MRNTNPITYPQNDRWAYLWLVIGVLLSMVSWAAFGQWIIPLAAWFSNVFLIRFMRSQRRPWLGYLILVAASAAYMWFALAPFLQGIRTSIVIGGALAGPLILLVDRLLVPRLRGFIATLVFPLTYTVFDFALSATNPLGSAGMIAYTQYDNLALLQLVSVTGMLGLSFLVAWFASVINWAWEHDWNLGQIKWGVALYAGLLALVLLYGQARLWLAPRPEETVRVAGVIPVDFRASQAELMEALNSDRGKFREMMAARYPLYFDATIREARAGAKLVVWPEHAAPVAEEDLPTLLARASEVAKTEGIYLTVPMMYFPAGDAPYEAKVVIFDPNGEVVLEHLKYGGIGMEGNRVNGDGVLRTAATPFGVLSALICWDTDYPRTVLQAGRNGTDILISPSLGHRDISPLHGYMAVMRAIENGVSVVRVGDNELSVITDAYGRTLASLDPFAEGERVIVAQVPTDGVPTLYPIIDDVVGWLALAGLGVLIVLAIVGRRRHVTSSADTEEKPAPPFPGGLQPA